MPTLSVSAISADIPVFSTRITVAIDAIKEGRPVILLDDSDRENEADLIIAAEKITYETMALLIRECSGIVCLCLTDEILERLKLPLMVAEPDRKDCAAFTISIDAKEGITTGVSAADRVLTIQATIADQAVATDLIRPGHIFPLRAQPGGVLTRRGHTEGAIDLAVLAGLKPAAVLCELMNPDGTMMRGLEIEVFAEKYNLPLLTMDELVMHQQAMKK